MKEDEQNEIDSILFLKAIMYHSTENNGLFHECINIISIFFCYLPETILNFLFEVGVSPYVIA